VEVLSDKQVRIFFEKDESIAERIVEASTQNRWRLREIHFEKGVLDDVFKQLSSQSQQ
jgi:ABC-2 type transport system ATP-binding protein